MSQAKIHLATVVTVQLVGYYIQVACAYNIEDFYNTGQIDPPSIVKIVYIFMHALYIHRKIKLNYCSQCEYAFACDFIILW